MLMVFEFVNGLDWNNAHHTVFIYHVSHEGILHINVGGYFLSNSLCSNARKYWSKLVITVYVQIIYQSQCNVLLWSFLDACTAIHKFKGHFWSKLVIAACPNNLSKPSTYLIYYWAHAQPFTNSNTITWPLVIAMHELLHSNDIHLINWHIQ